MKYIGSKAKIAADIVPILQSCIDDNAYLAKLRLWIARRVGNVEYQAV